MDYCLLITSQSRVLCRGEQLLSTFSDRGSRQFKLFRESRAFQSAESAGRLFSTSCSSTCRATRIIRDLKSPAQIPDQGLYQPSPGLDLQNYLAKMFALLHPGLGLRRVR